MLDCLLIRRGMLAAILLLPLVAHAQSTDARAILDASDRIRNPPGSFSVKLQLSEYRQGKLANSNVLTVYARPSETEGDYRNLVRFVAPARDAGKLMLRNARICGSTIPTVRPACASRRSSGCWAKRRTATS